MIKNRKSFSLHLLLFIAVEVLLVVIIFHEFPETNVFTAIGIGHVTYWLIVLLAGVRREHLMRVWQRFLATYIPLVYHVGVHVRAGAEALHGHEDELEHVHGAAEHTWMIIGTIAAGLLIFRGERLLHRKYHCDTHHTHDHKNCLEKGHIDCEKSDL